MVCASLIWISHQYYPVAHIYLAAANFESYVCKLEKIIPGVNMSIISMG